jgi:hypothetical protein
MCEHTMQDAFDNVVVAVQELRFSAWMTCDTPTAGVTEEIFSKLSCDPTRPTRSQWEGGRANLSFERINGRWNIDIHEDRDGWAGATPPLTTHD